MGGVTEGDAHDDPGPDRLRSLAAAIPDGVVAVQEGRIAWASDRFVEMAGHRDVESLRGRIFGDQFADTGNGLPNAVGRAVECALRRPDGECRQVVCRGVEPGREADFTAWVLEDVTHTRTLERELLRMSQQLHRANREVAALRERLHRESDEREELLTVVSHELRTPVTIISGYNKLLLSEQVGPLTDEQRRFLDESSKGCHRLNTFIGNLLEACRVPTEGEVLEIAHGKLSPIIEGVVGLLRPLLEDSELALRVSVSPDADFARFDRTRLEQILTNLVGNAIKFSPPHGAIEIETRPVALGSAGTARRFVEVRVSDQGPGVALEDRERIFEPYVQVGEESRAGGLGLGLAICKRLVEAHGGSISVLEGTAAGSAFAFTLPVTDHLNPQPDPTPGGADDAPSATSHGGP